ncbi:MAG TPA: hypothetical protein VGX50_03650, partial [Longimicrobium sp.]|nr:hypothetical protein [Longimicrobium sp.]
MIVVHACWSPFGLHLWGESAQRLAALTPPRGRTPRAVRPHPFAADARELRQALHPLMAERPAAGEITLHLPSRGRVPLASPQLAHVAPAGAASGADGQTTAWTAGVLSLSGPDALDVLLALPAAGDRAGMEDVVLGDSVRAFGEFAKLALEMVAGGRVLPLLERTHGGRWTARWRPVVAAEADGERLALLRRTMPGACAAHAPAADDVAGRVLDALVDAGVRQGLEEHGFSPLRREVQRAPADAWRDALFAPRAEPREGGAAWERVHAAL